jgi:hypothetical protein
MCSSVSPDRLTPEQVFTGSLHECESGRLSGGHHLPTARGFQERGCTRGVMPDCRLDPATALFIGTRGGTYGALRVHAELRHHGIRLARKRVARPMTGHDSDQGGQCSDTKPDSPSVCIKTTRSPHLHILRYLILYKKRVPKSPIDSPSASHDHGRSQQLMRLQTTACPLFSLSPGVTSPGLTFSPGRPALYKRTAPSA